MYCSLKNRPNVDMVFLTDREFRTREQDQDKDPYLDLYPGVRSLQTRFTKPQKYRERARNGISRHEVRATPIVCTSPLTAR